MSGRDSEPPDLSFLFPDREPAPPPERRRGISRRGVVKALVAVSVGTAVGIGGLVAKEKGMIPGVAPSKLPVIGIPKKIDWPFFKEAFNAVTEQYSRVRSSGYSRDEVFEESRELLRGGIDLYNRSKPAYPVEMVDKDTMQFFEDRLDLRSQHGMVFGGGALYAELAALHKDPEAARMPIAADLNIRLLSGKMEIQDSDTSPFVPPSELAYLHLMFKATEKAGLGNAKKWQQTDRDQRWDSKEGVMYFRGDSILSAWPRFHINQEGTLVKDLQDTINKVAHGEQNVDLITLPDNGFRVDPSEFAAGAFLNFVSRGVDYERRAKALEHMVSPNGAALIREQRDRLMATFKGTEFTYDGTPRQPQPVYRRNQLVGARNIRPLMRNTITMEALPGNRAEPSAPDGLIIADRTILELMDGPSRVIDTRRAMAVDYWLVSGGAIWPGGRWVSGANYPRGRLASENLGEVIGVAR